MTRRFSLTATALVILAVLVLALSLGEQGPEPPTDLPIDTDGLYEPPHLRGQKLDQINAHVPQVVDPASREHHILVRVMDRLTRGVVGNLALTTSHGELRTDESGEAWVPAEDVANVRPASDAWRVAPGGVDGSGVLWVVGRLRLRLFCSVAGAPVPATEDRSAIVEIVRPVGVSLEEQIQAPQSLPARVEWLRRSRLTRERHCVPVQEGGLVEVLTWEAPSQAFRITIDQPRRICSPVLAVPASGALIRSPIPVVEVTVDLDEILYKIGGHVVTAEGKPVRDAEVLVVILRRMDPRDVDPRVMKPEGHTLGIIKRGDEDRALVLNDLVARTTQDGEFQLLTPVDGENVLIVVHEPGYARGSQHLARLSGADSEDVEIVLSQSLRTDRCVMRRGGVPLAAGDLRVIETEAEPQFHFKLKVDEDGTFATEWLAFGHVYHLLYQPAEGEFFLSGDIEWEGGRELNFEEMTRARCSPPTTPRSEGEGGLR